MFERLDGELYKQLLSYGIKNLKLHEEIINDLNVFPVPDGDTGTNMTMTLTNGFEAIRDIDGELSVLAAKFAYAVAFGARGNSGVISSQFFKGFSEHLSKDNIAEPAIFIQALEQGVTEAYKAVSKPTEGTILTVVREATEHAKELYEEGKIHSVLDVIDAFLDEARISLEKTPELLPVLKNAGVVDSGGAGILYFFKGMKKYMMNEDIQELDMDVIKEETVDYSLFNRQTKFDYGYCTEVLLQLTDGKEIFAYNEFKDHLEDMGDSVATIYTDEKVKVHIHTMEPEKVLSYCHRFGEFLTMKLENMSVQHTHIQEKDEQEEVYEHRFMAIVATASDELLEQKFKSLGVASVIKGGQSCNPSVQDFLAAFKKANADHIIVFPNNKNVILTANQAKKLYEDANIIVINSTSMAECHSALGMIDYDSDDVDGTVNLINEIIANTDIVSISKAVRNTTYDTLKITVEDYVAIDDNQIVEIGKTMGEVVYPILERYLENDDKDVLTLFTGKDMKKKEIQKLVDYVEKKYVYVDCGVVETDSEIYHLILSFE